jgi:hypothetical protein
VEAGQRWDGNWQSDFLSKASLRKETLKIFPDSRPTRRQLLNIEEMAVMLDGKSSVSRRDKVKVVKLKDHALSF